MTPILALLLGILMAPDAPSAAASAALRQRLSQLVRPEFEIFAWSPAFHVSAGLIYDDRLEPCSIEIAALQKTVAAAPEDAAARLRLGILLNRYGPPGSGEGWIAEAVKICQRRLAATPDAEQALIQFALVRAGSEEGERAARKATELYPKSWQAWDALARHEWRRLEQRVLGNQTMTLQELAAADYMRFEKVMAAHASDPDLADALLELDAAQDAHAKQAMAAAPDTLEPLLHYIEARTALGMVAPVILRLLNEKTDRATFDKETLRLLDRAVALGKQQPEALGVIGFRQLQIKITMSQAALARTVRPPPDGEAPKRPPPTKLDQKTLPVFARLRELIGGNDLDKSAAATEAYAGLLALIPMTGGEIKPVPELPELLNTALEHAPKRPLLWDLWLGEQFAAASRGELAPGADLRSLALRRLKQLPSGRSHATVAFASRGDEARVSWLEAAKLEPTNIEFLLNLAASMVQSDQSQPTIEAAIAIVQRASELSYQDRSWQKPRLDAFRLRTYAVCLIFKGELERAHALLIERLQQFPGDMASRAIRDALVSE